MKSKLCVVGLAIACLIVALNAHAATVLGKSEYIIGFSDKTYSFIADQTPLVYQVTLTDFDEPAAFDFLSVAITTSTAKIAVLTILAPDLTAVTTFNAAFGETYFANVLGDAADNPGAGLFGLDIRAVPIPPSLILFGCSVVGLVILRRRVR